MTRLGTLVLGGSGFLGRALLDEARRAEAARDLRDGRDGGRCVGTEAQDRPRVLAVSRRPDAGEMRRGAASSVDLCVPGALERLLDEQRPARVVNAAAAANPADCEADPALAEALNARLPGELAGLCAARGTRLVHASTDLVFGAEPAPPGGFDERDAPGPISVYGRSKLDGERRVAEADAGAAIARLPLLFGDSRGRARGASDALLAALARGEVPRLFTDERRSPLDVDVAAAALIELAWRGEAGLLHVAGPDRLTRYDLGMLVLSASRVPTPGDIGARSEWRIVATTRAEEGVEANRPADVCLDAARARGLLATRLVGVGVALARDEERC
jgi:dTDP-4-dehydrorhamnose reductase